MDNTNYPQPWHGETLQKLTTEFIKARYEEGGWVKVFSHLKVIVDVYGLSIAVDRQAGSESSAATPKELFNQITAREIWASSNLSETQRRSDDDVIAMLTDQLVIAYERQNFEGLLDEVSGMIFMVFGLFGIPKNVSAAFHIEISEKLELFLRESQRLCEIDDQSAGPI